MAKARRWKGPFYWRHPGDRRCLKCDAKSVYFLTIPGGSAGVCREHAIEGLTSREGGLTLKEATAQLDENDSDLLEKANTHLVHWVSVRSRLPGIGKRVVVCWADKDNRPKQIGIAAYFGDKTECGRFLFWFDAHGAMYATHWMEPPPLPRESE